MLTKRIIACMDVRAGQVVKGVQFQQLRHAGDPAELAARYNVEGIDEVVILDITATLESRQALADTISAVARRIFLPLTVGGGIRSEDDAAAAVDAGADKVSLNTAALKNPALITTLARRYGSQAVIVAIDAKRRGDGFAVYVRSGTSDAARDAVEWAREAQSRGAGEILLTSMDRDGTRSGFDCEMTAAVANAVNIPVIASGGAGGLEHFCDVFTRGHADAALAASIFHYADTSVSELKRYLRGHNIPVRI
ncbi:MAG TPA: imidazole glycerol phosphate synthase subunit HisF [Vicinamibacterales bacterium]|nr:imidazole glycerol phosphate synthase subunit HisF [Vicinamibacterales bacterium]